LRDRATRNLTYNDEQFHALEKIKVSETGKRVKALLNDEVKPAVAAEGECLADWYKMSQTIFLQTQILEKDVAMYEDKLYEIKTKLVQLKDSLKAEMEGKKQSKVVSPVVVVPAVRQRSSVDYKNEIRVRWAFNIIVLVQNNLICFLFFRH
jgi:hypothetical protein